MTEEHITDEETSAMAAKIKDLEMENDILKQTIEILKKIRASTY